MARFTGFMCDVCSVAENGQTRPEHWLAVKLPGLGEDSNRDICSDRCLLKFAKERHGGSKGKNPVREKVVGLSEFLDTRGVKPSAKGAVSARHTRQRHELSGGVEDCLVCEFLTGTED